MAYVYDGLNSLLGQQEDEENDFLQNPTISTAGAGGESMSSPTSKVGGTSTQAVQGGEASKAFFTKNKAPTEAGARALQPIGQQVAQARTNLQQAADKYTQGAGANLTGVTDEDINKAAGGDEGAKTRIGVAKSGAKQQAENFAYKPEDIDDLSILKGGEESGISQMLSRQGGEDVGKNLFDISARQLMRDSGFQKQRGDILRQGEQYSKERASIPAEAQKKAQSTIDEKIKAIQAGTMGSLRKYVDERNARFAEAKRTKDADIDRRRAGDEQMARAMEQVALSELLKERPDMERWLKNADVDEKKNIRSKGGKSDSIYSYASPEEIAQFNNIVTLLGEGTITPDRSAFQDYSADIDRAGIKDALLADAMGRMPPPQVLAEEKARQDYQDAWNNRPLIPGQLALPDLAQMPTIPDTDQFANAYDAYIPPPMTEAERKAEEERNRPRPGQVLLPTFEEPRRISDTKLPQGKKIPKRTRF